MKTFIIVFQSVKVRSDKCAEVVVTKDFNEAYRMACVIQKHSFRDYSIKSISEA